MTLVGKTVTNTRLMSIDPSINNLGMAIWDMKSRKLIMWKLVHPTKDAKDTEYDKSLSMLRQIKQWITTYNVTRLICEVPEHWAVAGFHARETGSIAKLCFVCGMLYSLYDSLDECKIVTPAMWKGQLPKEVVANRLYKSYESYGFDLRDPKQVNPNVADAIEIGHFYFYGSV